MQFPDSDATCRWVREQTDWILLGFSGGKDSLASWIKLRKFFDHDKIIPICMLFVPGPPENNGKGTLPYLDRVLDYYESWFGQRIYRIPHTYFYTMMAGNTYQPPERFGTMLWLNSQSYFPILEHHDYMRWIKSELGIPNAWNATGIRMHDNLMRRTAIKRHGGAVPTSKMIYPVWDYTIEMVRNEIDAEGVQLSQDYYMFGRSLGGLDARFTGPIRDSSPADWAVLKHWFPMIDLDIFRYECRERLLARQEEARRAEEAA